MNEGKPLIAILMAVYEPRLDWLKEQLASLEAQTYPNLRLYVRDDCSPTVPFGDIQECIRSCIHSFPCEIKRNEKNLGSNGTFERLTEEAEGEYFACCDQDDVWHPRKLEVLQRTIEAEKAALVCSDMYVIDEKDRQIADSITRVWPHHVFFRDENPAPKLLMKTFALGCAMLIRSEIAKAALPFCPYMVYDHYLALYAATRGKIYTISMPLLSHRMHGDNQTQVLAGVTDRDSYYQIRLQEREDRLIWLQNRFADSAELSAEIRNARRWLKARKNCLLGNCGEWKTVWKYRNYDRGASLFELVMGRMPEPFFMLAVRLIQKGIL